MCVDLKELSLLIFSYPAISKKKDNTTLYTHICIYKSYEKCQIGMRN